MKSITIILLVLASILSSCGTYNSKIKFQRSSNVSFSETESFNSQVGKTEIQPELFGTDSVTVKIDEIAPVRDQKVMKETKTAIKSSNLTENSVYKKIHLLEKLFGLDPEHEKYEEIARYTEKMGMLSYIPLIGWIFAIVALLLGNKFFKYIKATPSFESETASKQARRGVKNAIIGLSLGIILMLLIILAIGAEFGLL